MRFRYDMKDKSPTAQAIVRQREMVEELREQRRKKKRKSEVNCIPSPKLADYEGVYFQKEGRNILELRVSGSAIVNGPCGLKDINVHDWLCKTGQVFIDEVNEYEILMITSQDVRDQKLLVSWKNLRREQK